MEDKDVLYGILCSRHFPYPLRNYLGIEQIHCGSSAPWWYYNPTRRLGAAGRRKGPRKFEQSLVGYCSSEQYNCLENTSILVRIGRCRKGARPHSTRRGHTPLGVIAVALQLRRSRTRWVPIGVISPTCHGLPKGMRSRGRS
jgi:hypothetical protein